MFRSLGSVTVRYVRTAPVAVMASVLLYRLRGDPDESPDLFGLGRLQPRDHRPGRHDHPVTDAHLRQRPGCRPDEAVRPLGRRLPLPRWRRSHPGTVRHITHPRAVGDRRAPGGFASSRGDRPASPGSQVSARRRRRSAGRTGPPMRANARKSTGSPSGSVAQSARSAGLPCSDSRSANVEPRRGS